MQVLGAYGQTELGHGTNIRGLETTATYDPETEEFIMNTPTLTSYKWWAGTLGKTANHCVVLAQLWTQGKCHGIYPFIVQIRDLDTHQPLPGVHVGDVGPRMGYTTADNGFLGMKNVRIPRENMPMKNAQVLKDGTFVKKDRHGKLTYGTMVFVRVTLVSDAAFYVAKAATIAVRYSAVRRQCQAKENEPELQILDYRTQQHKLFICIATAHALQLAARWLWKTFTDVLADLREGNVEKLPELHALSSCLKSVSTSDASTCVEQCRYACGGHGYMMSSNLPYIYGHAVAIRTYEGDYTVLLLQGARYLVKAWEQMEAGNRLTPTVAYLSNAVSNQQAKWENTPEGIIRAFQAVAAAKIQFCVQSIRDLMKSGKCYEDAWQLTTLQLVEAAEVHCRAVMLDTYWKENLRLTASCSDNVKRVLRQLTSLYIIYWALDRAGDLLRYTCLSEKNVNILERQYEELLAALRPNAVGLVDAFDIRDEILNSSLGAYDGHVYIRLMEEAMKSPLNVQEVDPSFHKYIRPLAKGKL
ncbi:probable peroxisomal acyl-coenzyme A oxidase 1 isoform X2 [Aricia agestis]|nr:probable peroxisomal acyl-coenzyme A oxidase 1 isoform X2 [Aricia agestis]